MKFLTTVTFLVIVIGLTYAQSVRLDQRPEKVVEAQNVIDTDNTFACLSLGKMHIECWNQTDGTICQEPINGTTVVAMSIDGRTNVIRNEGNCLSGTNDSDGLLLTFSPGAAGISIRAERFAGELEVVLWRIEENIGDDTLGWVVDTETTLDVIDVSLGSTPPFIAVRIRGALGRVDVYEWAEVS